MLNLTCKQWFWVEYYSQCENKLPTCADCVFSAYYYLLHFLGHSLKLIHLHAYYLINKKHVLDE